MRVVERMTQEPPRCLHCGAGNVPGADGEVEPALDLERDIGWGDPTYLCGSCVSQAAALWGYISEDTAQDYERQIKKLKADLHETKAKFAEQSRRVRRVTEGKKALQELKTEASGG